MDAFHGSARDCPDIHRLVHPQEDVPILPEDHRAQDRRRDEARKVHSTRNNHDDHNNTPLDLGQIHWSQP